MTEARVKRERTTDQSDDRCSVDHSHSDPSFTPQPVYCVLDYPYKEFLGVGTCAIFTGRDAIEAFKKFNERTMRLVEQHAARTGKRPPSKPLCPRAIVLEIFRFEHTFVVHDDDPESAQSQVDGLEGRCFFAELDPNITIWVATNYITDYAPWRWMLFCCASTLDRAKHLIYEELESLAAEEGRPLDDVVEFDLHALREDYTGTTVVHFTGIEGQPTVPAELFDFVGTVKMVDPNRILVSPVSLQSDESGGDGGNVSKDPRVGSKRNNRATVTTAPPHSEISPKYSDATLPSPDDASVSSQRADDASNASTMSVAAPESDNTEALLAEMHEFMKSEEKELVPTTKKHRRSSSSALSSSKHSAASSTTKGAQEAAAEKKKD